MHDLAPLKLASPITVGWEEARIPSCMLTGFDAIHLKAVPARENELLTTYGLPDSLAASMVGNVEALWIGPGEWLLLARSPHLRELDQIQHRTNEEGIASVRCGSRLCILELDMEADVLAGLTGLPTAALEPNRVARTRLAGILVTLAANADGSTMRIIFDRSFAPHLRAWLDCAI